MYKIPLRLMTGVALILSFGCSKKSGEDAKPEEPDATVQYYIQADLAHVSYRSPTDTVPGGLQLWTDKKVFYYSKYNFTTDKPVKLNYTGGIFIADGETHMKREPGMSTFTAEASDVFEVTENGKTTTWKPGKDAVVNVVHQDMTVCLCGLTDGQIKTIGNIFVRDYKLHTYIKEYEINRP